MKMWEIWKKTMKSMALRLDHKPANTSVVEQIRVVFPGKQNERSEAVNVSSHNVYNKSTFLPPASEVWGRCCFHRCLSVHRMVPQSQVLSQVTGPRSFPGGTPVLAWRAKSWLRGCPSPGGGTRTWVHPSPRQNSEHLLRGGRYTSCVHAVLTYSTWHHSPHYE